MTPDQLRQSKIVVLLGGQSAERDISLQSGQTVVSALQSLGLDVLAVDTAQSDWALQLQGASLAFIALHGPGGEDGSMQGALQTLGVPYTGSGVLGSALAMDKKRCKQLWQGIGVATPGFTTLTPSADWQGIIDRLGKVFVKPAREGSSIGMSTADTAIALQQAYELASQYSGEVLAEQFINGPEYTVAILGDSALSLRAFRSLDCAVWGRVDVMRDASGRFFVLEVNTVPGMTSHSLVPMAAAAAGIDIAGLVQRIAELSLSEDQ